MSGYAGQEASGVRCYNRLNKSGFADELLELSSFFKVFKPHTVNCYVFSLVFALMGNLQGKVFLNVSNRFLPPYPKALRMSAEAAAYPKLLKVYKELNRQNGIIFDAERERNSLEIERDSLKGLAKLTKKGELQSRIDCKNEEIDLLKVGLSGIVKRYGVQNVHDFYKTFAVSKTANAEYRDKAEKWEEKIFCVINAHFFIKSVN